MNPDTLEQFNEFVAAIQQHKLWGSAGLFTLLITGVLLWASGRRVLKPIFAVLGALAGGFLGHAILPAIGPDPFWGVSSDLAGAAVGGAIGALAAIMIFRIAIGLLSALVVGGLAVLAVSVFIQTNEPAPTENSPIDSPESMLVEPENSLDEDSSAWREPGTLLEKVGEDSDEPGKFVGDLYRGARSEFWDPLSGHSQMLLTSAGLAGIVGGLALGVLAPKKTTALVTAFSGAGMWLPSIYFLSQTFELPGKAILERLPIEWLVIWLVVSMTGLFIQWQGLTDRKKGKRSKRDDDDKDDDDDDKDRDND